MSWIARHKAAHAAACLLLNRRVESVRIGGPPGFAGMVRAPIAYGGIKSRDMVVALLGPLVDGTPDWPPAWPLRPDERENVGVIASALNLDRGSYDQLCRIAKRLLGDPEFQKRAALIECVLRHVHVLRGELVYALNDALMKEQPQDEARGSSSNAHRR